MKTAAAIEAFGSVKALADALEVSPQAIYQWGEEVPDGRDFQIEVLTEGKLKARPGQQHEGAAA